MYEGYWELREKPFRKTPDPRYLFLNETYEEALERLLFAVEEMELALLTGEVGSGKTLLTRALVDRVGERFEAGMINEVDVNQSEILLADAEASVEVFRRGRVQTENALGVLLGRTPGAVALGLDLQDQVFPPEIPAGLPSELIQRRPDILQAERRLAAQTARIGVAEALKFPSLSLTGSAGVSGDLADGSVATGFLNLGANLLGPIFNAGKNQRRVDIEVARAEQLLNQYQQTILTALREVEDAIAATYTYRSEYEARLRQVDAAARAADLSWARYEGGMTSYLEVLDLQRSQFSAELAASEALQLHLSSIVELYKALGGGWTAPEQLAAAELD